MDLSNSSCAFGHFRKPPMPENPVLAAKTEEPDGSHRTFSQYSEPQSRSVCNSVSSEINVSEKRRVDNPEEAHLMSTLVGEWTPVSSTNVDEYFEKRGFSEQLKAVFDCSHLHIEFDGKLIVTSYNNSGKIHFLISTELEKTFYRNGVVRTFFIEDNCLHTIAMETRPGAVINREKKFIRDGRLHVVRMRDGLEFTRIYERVGRNEGVTSRQSDCRVEGAVAEDVIEERDARDERILTELTEINKTLEHRQEKEKTAALNTAKLQDDLKDSLKTLLAEMAEVKKQLNAPKPFDESEWQALVKFAAMKLHKSKQPKQVSNISNGGCPIAIEEVCSRSSNHWPQDPPRFIDVPVTLEEVLTGTKKEMTTKKITLIGDIQKIELKTYELLIPPGIPAGSRLIFPRDGDQRPGRIPADIVFIIRDKPHPIFTRQGCNLVWTEKIGLFPPAMFPVPLLGGSRTLVGIDVVIKSGGRLEIPNQGLPRPDSTNSRGSLIVSFQRAV